MLAVHAAKIRQAPMMIGLMSCPCRDLDFGQDVRDFDDVLCYRREVLVKFLVVGRV